jgi:hypothetical protein
VRGRGGGEVGGEEVEEASKRGRREERASEKRQAKRGEKKEKGKKGKKGKRKTHTVSEGRSSAILSGPLSPGRVHLSSA